MRVALLVLLASVAVRGQPNNPFAYVPSHGRILSMEWRRVLDSPLREAIKKEIPADVLPLVSSINFIAGIQRVVVAREQDRDYIVLAGKFELDRIMDQASEDGGVTVLWRGAKLLAAPGSDETESQIALVNPSIVLLGPGDLIKSAIARSFTKRTALQAPGYDLWIRSASSKFGIIVSEPVRVEASVSTNSAERAHELASAAALHKLTAVQNGREVMLTGSIPRQEFIQRAGNWRATFENLHAIAPTAQRQPEPAGPQKIRIYGLEGGVKEIDFPKAQR